MTEVTLSAAPKGNGYQATVSYPNGLSISSAIAEPMTAAALKLLDMTDRLETLDRTEPPAGLPVGTAEWRARR